jgi:hypothetical protein
MFQFFVDETWQDAQNAQNIGNADLVADKMKTVS